MTFAQSLRVYNWIAVGESRIVFERSAFRRALENWKLDAEPVADLSP